MKKHLGKPTTRDIKRKPKRQRNISQDDNEINNRKPKRQRNKSHSTANNPIKALPSPKEVASIMLMHYDFGG